MPLNDGQDMEVERLFYSYMASPQKENGFTQISNEILEAFARTPSLGSEAFQVLMLVLRYTYGFQRKDAEMSISFIAKGTGMKKRNVSRTIERLVSKRMIVRDKSLMIFNKNHEEWVVSKRTGSVQSDGGGVSNRMKKVVSNRTDKKERVKENLIKEKDIASRNDAVQDSVKIKRNQNDPMTCDEFVALMKASPRRDMWHVGEWADTVRPELNTYGQWQVFLRRHIKPAAQLAKFDDHQIAVAFTKAMEMSENGKKFQPTIETLIKMLTA